MFGSAVCRKLTRKGKISGWASTKTSYGDTSQT